MKVNFRRFLINVSRTQACYLMLQLPVQNSKFQKSVRKLSQVDENWHP